MILVAIKARGGCLNSLSQPEFYAERTYDAALIRRLMGRMGPQIAEDGLDIDTWEPDLLKTCWLPVFIEADPVALFSLDALNSVTAEMHANVLPAYRALYRHDIAKIVFSWILHNAKEYQKIVTTVPFLHRHIKRYAGEMGMQVEGISRSSYIKDNRLWDQWYMGITRSEMQEVLA